MKARIAYALIAALALPGAAFAAEKPATQPKVRLTTSMGVIEIELDARRAPETTENFLNYVDKGFYDGTIFHRVIPGFMIQGGGFESGLTRKPTAGSIQNEADNGLKNVTGSIAMARTGAPHSATAQFFINTADNRFLNHRGKTTQGWGYAVFGRVTQGMDVVKKIESVPTGNAGHHENVPVSDVVIKKVERIEE